MSYKSTDALMRHLRDNGIDINGSTQKRQLINTGYFHGYKGYRFFKDSNNKLPFKSYKEVYATIQYDSALKSLMYSKIMYIETAIKNITLESIINYAKSEKISIILDKVVSGYHNSPTNSTPEQKRKFQQNKLSLQNSIQSNLANAYKKGNPQITHFYNKCENTAVPIWALFEIMTMGDLGYFLSCLTYEVRTGITQKIGFNLSCDSQRTLIYKYLYTLKDLRNAIAHNAVVFDTRFRNIDPDKAMISCLKTDIGLPYINFKTIGDYIILICYYMKLLKVSRTEIKTFIKDFEKIIADYKKIVNTNVVNIVIHKDLEQRMNILKRII